MDFRNARSPNAAQPIVFVTEVTRQQRYAYAGTCRVLQGRERIDAKSYPRIHDILTHPTANDCWLQSLIEPDPIVVGSRF